MKRRTLLKRIGQVAAGLGLAGLVAKEAAPAAAAPEPAGELFYLDSNGTLATTAETFVPMAALAPYHRFPDLLERGIRQVYFQDFWLRCAPTPKERYQSRLRYQAAMRHASKRRRL